MKKIRKIGIMLVVMAALFGAIQVSAASRDTEDVVKEGIHIEDIDVSDMTEKEVKKAVKDVVNSRINAAVSLKINKDTVNTTLKDLGYSWKNKSVVSEAMRAGKQGNVIRRYKDSIDLKKQGKTFHVEIDIEEKDFKKNLEALCKPYNVEAKNASLKATGHGFQIIPEVEGCVVNYSKTVKQFISYIQNDWDKKSEIAFEATTKIAKPKYTTKDF